MGANHNVESFFLMILAECFHFGINLADTGLSYGVTPTWQACIVRKEVNQPPLSLLGFLWAKY